MSDLHRKARDADRDDAVAVVEAAYAGRQITQADCELRVDRLRRAETVGEIHMLVQDLARVEHAPRVAPVARRSLVPGGTPQVNTRLLKPVLLVVGVVVALGAALPLGILADVEQDGASESGTFELGEDLELTTARGYRALATAVEQNTGSSTVFTATIYPGYAIVDVPVDRKGRRSASYRYDGSWREWSGSGTASAQRFDLDRIKGSTVVSLLRKITRRVDDPTSTYLLVNPPDSRAGVCVSAYASDDASESVSLHADCDGTVLFRS